MITWFERNPVSPPTTRTAAAYRVAARGDSFRRMGSSVLSCSSLHGFEGDEMEPQEFPDLGGAHGLAPVVNLGALASQAAQCRQLASRLHAFGDHGQVEGMGEGDHRLDDGGVARRTVDL